MRKETKGESIESYRNKIFCGDCIELMREIPSSSIDLIFADPPYNLQLSEELHRPDTTKVSGVFEEWDIFSDFKSYDDFSRDWLREARRILKEDGTIWVMGSYHNIYRLGQILQDLNYWILNDIVWLKSNPMPNFMGRRFTNAHETLLWCSRSRKSKYLFNYDAMKSLNEGIQMRSDWHFPLCTGSERLQGEYGKKLHPTQKPESLLYRVLLSSSKVGDVVLDPFLGTGTTAAVAKKLGRDYIGIERETSYAERAKTRVLETKPPESEAQITTTPTKRKEKQIPFGHLVEVGALKPGSQLVSSCSNYEAEVQADGSIKIGAEQGSIHQLGAKLQGKISCNGWFFWHIKDNDDKGSIPIDVLRAKIREERKSSTKTVSPSRLVKNARNVRKSVI